MFTNLVLCLADLVHRSSEKVTVSVAEVKRLVPYLHSKDQVRVMDLHVCMHTCILHTQQAEVQIMIEFQSCSLNASWSWFKCVQCTLCIQQDMVHMHVLHKPYTWRTPVLGFTTNFTFHFVLQPKFCLVPHLPFNFLLPPSWVAGAHHV